MINYDGKLFRKAGGGDGTVARYHQDGDLVWANFTGGKVRRGTVTGVCSPDGTLRLAYTMVLGTGEVISGQTVNVPQERPDGQLVLREEWERFGDHAASGVSYLEEVPARPVTSERMGSVGMTGWDGLRGVVDGRLRLPGDDGFEERSKPFNDRFRDVRPAAVLSVAGPDDVSRAIGWAKDAGVPVVARGGGHSYAGNSVNRGLVLDLQDLDHVHVDPVTALVTVGGGARTRAIYDALREHDLVFPLGNSDDVGIGGLVLGGGVSVVSRAMGLTCDSLVSTDLVLADGSTVTCSETENPDLFWACRGGGGGNFGVNTSFTFQARPVPAASTCLVLWDWPHAMDVLTVMQEVMRLAPNAFSARIGVSRAAGQPGVVSVIGQHLGPAEELRELLAPALAAAPPSRVDIADRTYWEAADYLHHETAGGAFAVRTRCTPAPLSEDGLRTLVTAVDKWPGSANPDGAGAALFTWGGAINDVPVTETAFPHRDALFLVSMDTAWLPDESPEVVRGNLDWLHDLHRDMGEHATDASYVNFTDPDLEDWRGAYHGPNAERLAEVKRRYDPDRVFSFSQAI
ncbi:FAD-binding oxidoreductase [Saccharothrix sp. HUAS TT1]|uniref:FAD-binding oxidoreductase n=1 Tax=unclassified Saccharothrix TaxID=2593673 RepID=UPI00345BF4CC